MEPTQITQMRARWLAEMKAAGLIPLYVEDVQEGLRIIAEREAGIADETAHDDYAANIATITAPAPTGYTLAYTTIDLLREIGVEVTVERLNLVAGPALCYRFQGGSRPRCALYVDATEAGKSRAAQVLREILAEEQVEYERRLRHG